MKSWLCQLHFLIAVAEYLTEKNYFERNDFILARGSGDSLPWEDGLVQSGSFRAVY